MLLRLQPGMRRVHGSILSHTHRGIYTSHRSRSLRLHVATASAKLGTMSLSLEQVWTYLNRIGFKLNERLPQPTLETLVQVRLSDTCYLGAAFFLMNATCSVRHWGWGHSGHAMHCAKNGARVQVHELHTRAVPFENLSIHVSVWGVWCIVNADHLRQGMA